MDACLKYFWDTLWECLQYLSVPPVLWVSHPYLLMWFNFILERHGIKQLWIVYMDTFDLNCIGNHSKIKSICKNVKCLFPMSGRNNTNSFRHMFMPRGKKRTYSEITPGTFLLHIIEKF